MQIPHTKLRALHMDRQIHLAPPRQILNVAIPAMLRPPGHRPRALAPDLGGQLPVLGQVPRVAALRQGRERDVAAGLQARVGGELALAAVPFREDGRGRRAAEDARVDEAGELDAGNVPRGAGDAFEIPDGFGAVEVGRLVSLFCVSFCFEGPREKRDCGAYAEG